MTLSPSPLEPQEPPDMEIPGLQRDMTFVSSFVLFCPPNILESRPVSSSLKNTELQPLSQLWMWSGSNKQADV